MKPDELLTLQLLWSSFVQEFQQRHIQALDLSPSSGVFLNPLLETVQVSFASAETLTPHTAPADARSSDTFFPLQCAAFSHARSRRQILFPSPTFPILPKSPCLLATITAVPAQWTRCQLRTAPSPRRSCDGRG